MQLAVLRQVICSLLFWITVWVSVGLGLTWGSREGISYVIGGTIFAVTPPAAAWVLYCLIRPQKRFDPGRWLIVWICAWLLGFLIYAWLTDDLGRHSASLAALILSLYVVIPPFGAWLVALLVVAMLARYSHRQA